MKKRASDTKQNRRRINVRKVMHRDHEKKNIHTEGTHGRLHTSQAQRSGKQKY